MEQVEALSRDLVHCLPRVLYPAFVQHALVFSDSIRVSLDQVLQHRQLIQLGCVVQRVPPIFVSLSNLDTSFDQDFNCCLDPTVKVASLDCSTA